jgi:hypothetical protein
MPSFNPTAALKPSKPSSSSPTTKIEYSTIHTAKSRRDSLVEKSPEKYILVRFFSTNSYTHLPISAIRLLEVDPTKEPNRTMEKCSPGWSGRKDIQKALKALEWSLGWEDGRFKEENVGNGGLGFGGIAHGASILNSLKWSKWGEEGRVTRKVWEGAEEAKVADAGGGKKGKGKGKGKDGSSNSKKKKKKGAEIKKETELEKGRISGTANISSRTKDIISLQQNSHLQPSTQSPIVSNFLNPN